MKLTIDQALGMLKDDQKPLDLAVLAETITDLSEKAQTAEAALAASVSEQESLKAAVEGGEHHLSVAKASIAELTAKVDQSKVETEARKAKVVDQILGKMEVCGASTEKRETTKELLAGMDFAALDDRMETVSEEWRTKFAVAPVGEPPSDPDGSGLSSLAMVSA